MSSGSSTKRSDSPPAPSARLQSRWYARPPLATVEAQSPPSARENSRRALLAALAPDGDRFRRLVEAEAERLDWTWMLNRALAHKVGALFAARVLTPALEAILPSTVASGLRETESIAAERIAKAQWTLQRVTRQFEAAAVPFLLLKGGILAEHVYRSPAHRPFSDVDVLISPEHLAPADEALKAEGYFLHRREIGTYQPTEANARERQLALLRHFTYKHADRDRYLPVDLHWRLTRPGRPGLELQAVWDDSEAVAVSGVTVRSLKPEAFLLHLAIHALELGPAGFHLLHLCDVAWTVDRLRDRIDRDQLWQLARGSAARNELRQALRLAERLLGCRAADELRPPFWFASNDWMFRLASSERAIVDQPVSVSRWRRSAGTTADRTLWEIGLLRLPQKKIRRWLYEGPARWSRRAGGAQ